MNRTSFDDPALQARMADFLAAVAALDETSAVGGEARELLDLAERKAMAGLALRKRLTDLGWSEPVPQRSST